MSNSDDEPTGNEELSDAVKDRWSQRLASKEPLMSHLFDEPMNVRVGQQGEILIDCPCLVLDGFDHAGIVRVELTPAATDRLRPRAACCRKVVGRNRRRRSTH